MRWCLRLAWISRRNPLPDPQICKDFFRKRGRSTRLSCWRSDDYIHINRGAWSAQVAPCGRASCLQPQPGRNSPQAPSGTRAFQPGPAVVFHFLKGQRVVGAKGERQGGDAKRDVNQSMDDLRSSRNAESPEKESSPTRNRPRPSSFAAIRKTRNATGRTAHAVSRRREQRRSLLENVSAIAAAQPAETPVGGGGGGS